MEAKSKRWNKRNNRFVKEISWKFLNPGKNAQIAAKKISEKYKKIRDAKKYKY